MTVIFQIQARRCRAAAASMERAGTFHVPSTADRGHASHLQVLKDQHILMWQTKYGEGEDYTVQF